MKCVAVLLFVAGVTTGAWAEARAQAGKSSHLEHELTNRVLHPDHSPHHERSSSSERSGNQQPHLRQAGHALPQKERLLDEKRLLLAQPHYSQMTALPHYSSKKIQRNNETVSGLHGTFQKQSVSSKVQKLAKLSKLSKARQAVSAGGRTGHLDAPASKGYKGRRTTTKKYSPKKHAWKKGAHKEKTLRNKQTRQDVKERKHAGKKEVNAKMARKDKTLKKKEKREKRAKVMGHKRE